MKKLIEEGLYGSDLVTIDGPRVVDFYNGCLDAIGLEPTELKKFSIDGMGWSPEIAEERGNHYYLFENPASPFLIIVSDSQEGKPIYTPFHSFDRPLMRRMFSSFGRQIACLTSMTGLYIELDQRLSHYTSPRDLLMIDSILVRVNSVGDFIDAARNQRELVQSFNQQDNWKDKVLREKIIESARVYGDLRTKPVIIEDMPFTDIRSFYARAFGGVYVLRDDLGDKKPILILEGDEKHGIDEEEVLHIDDRESVLNKLYADGWLECAPGYFKPDILNRIKDVMLSEAIFKHNPDETVGSLRNRGKRQRYVSQLNGELPQEFFEMERLIIQFESGGPESIDPEGFSPGLHNLLLRPKIELREKDPVLFDLLMKIVVRLQPVPPEVVYGYDKNLFFDRYQKWSDAKRQWAIGWIKDNRVRKQTRLS